MFLPPRHVDGQKATTQDACQMNFGVGGKGDWLDAWPTWCWWYYGHDPWALKCRWKNENQVIQAVACLSLVGRKMWTQIWLFKIGKLNDFHLAILLNWPCLGWWIHVTLLERLVKVTSNEQGFLKVTWSCATGVYSRPCGLSWAFSCPTRSPQRSPQGDPWGCTRPFKLYSIQRGARSFLTAKQASSWSLALLRH